FPTMLPATLPTTVPSIPTIASPFRGSRAPVARSLRMLTASLHRAGCNGAPANRRREMRRAARLGCTVRRMDSWRLVGDRTVDLSPEGMLILSDERLDQGTELVVSFQATELPIWFDTLATVTRVVEGRRPGDAGRAIGVHFETLPAVSRLILRGHLRRHPLTMPRRDRPVELLSPDPDYAQIVKDIWAGR
ncbi:MAG TPA: PilZ domain-containing protein, partial [Polyangiaceae bacterium]|nr:PilZ domain-containing protein [Polyangiaceae bacterium]